VTGPDGGWSRARRAGHPYRSTSVWRPVLLWALAAGAVSVLAVWWLLPRTPDAFAGVGTAVQAGTANGTSTIGGLPVYSAQISGTPGPAVSAPPQPPGPPTPPLSTPTPTPSFTPQGPGPNAPNMPGTPSPGATSPLPHGSGLGQHPAPFALRAAYATAPPTALPSDAIGRDVARAARYSPEIAVEIARDRFAVAPVTATGRPSPLPVLLIAALLTALAALGGALFGRRRARWEPLPATVADTTVRMPAGTEAVASQELGRLRREAERKRALARRLAELLPGMPDALAWQAQNALTEVGVRAMVPDGEPFDAAVHHAVGTEPVPRGSRANTIARTVRPGYADDETILVYPKVVVYADDADGAAP
jgi:GrpE